MQKNGLKKCKIRKGQRREARSKSHPNLTDLPCLACKQWSIFSSLYFKRTRVLYENSRDTLYLERGGKRKRSLGVGEMGVRLGGLGDE